MFVRNDKMSSGVNFPASSGRRSELVVWPSLGEARHHASLTLLRRQKPVKVCVVTIQAVSVNCPTKQVGDYLVTCEYDLSSQPMIAGRVGCMWIMLDATKKNMT